MYLQQTNSGCWSIWKCWLCGTSSKYGPSFIAQSSINQLALSPGCPAQPSNSCDEVRFVLHGSSLTWYTFASVVCVDAVSETTSQHVKFIGAGRSHGLAGKTSLMRRLHWADKHDNHHQRCMKSMAAGCTLSNGCVIVHGIFWFPAVCASWREAVWWIKLNYWAYSPKLVRTNKIARSVITTNHFPYNSKNFKPLLEYWYLFWAGLA